MEIEGKEGYINFSEENLTLEPFTVIIKFKIEDADIENIKRFFYEGGDNMSFNGAYDLKPNVRPYGKLVDSKTIAHTVMRFDTMTEKQLWTRMGKITSLEKLLAFAYIAEKRNIGDLSIAALARYVRLGGDPRVMSWAVSKSEPKKDEKTDRLLRKLDI